MQREENLVTGEIPSEKDENQQQTQLSYDTGQESNPGHIGGRRALSPLRHLCSPFENLLVDQDNFTYFNNSHDLSALQCIGIARRKLMSITLGNCKIRAVFN